MTNASFVAQTVDWNPPHLYATLRAAFEHRGFSFVRILQRCPAYTDFVFEELQQDPSHLLLLTHPQGIPLEPNVLRLFPQQREHDPGDLGAARAVAEQGERVPIGLLFRDPTRPRYEQLTSRGLDMTPGEKLAALNRALDHFAV
jgi:2-oxoglutarate ferredoxin oxidoreductase subunit beta